MECLLPIRLIVPALLVVQSFFAQPCQAEEQKGSTPSLRRSPSEESADTARIERLIPQLGND
jgi:hypothetical protein